MVVINYLMISERHTTYTYMRKINNPNAITRGKTNGDKQAKIGTNVFTIEKLVEEYKKEPGYMLHDVKTLQSQHEYFTQDYYSKIKELSESYVALFTKEADRIKALNQQKPPVIQKPPATNNQTSSVSNKNHGLIQKAQTAMTLISKALSVVTTTTDIQPREFYDHNLALINRTWDQIQELYSQICDNFIDVLNSGFDVNQFYELNDMVQAQLINLSVMANKVQNVDAMQTTLSPIQSTISVHLPKITIPKFDGDYLKWQQFFDLFSEVVDKQPIPTVQKMWYLKTNLTGEANQLISHFTLTEKNYNAAWNTLKERFNNKRIQVSTLIEKILNQPSGTSSALAIKNLHDVTKECLLALNNIGIETSSWDAILIQLLSRKLDKNTCQVHAITG